MGEHALSAPTIRVVLVAVTGLLGDIVRETLEVERDVTLVEEVRDCATLERVLGRSRPDLVILAVDRGDTPGACPGLFEEHPGIKLLTVREDGRRSYLWELRPCPTALGELSPRLLVETIRKVVAR